MNAKFKRDTREDCSEDDRPLFHHACQKEIGMSKAASGLSAEKLLEVERAGAKLTS